MRLKALEALSSQIFNQRLVEQKSRSRGLGSKTAMFISFWNRIKINLALELERNQYSQDTTRFTFVIGWSTWSRMDNGQWSATKLLRASRTTIATGNG